MPTDMPSATTTPITAEQVQFYHEHGYVLLRQAVSEATLQRSQTVLERWVNEVVGQWLAQGLLSDARPDLPFDRRLLVLWQAAGKPRYTRSPRRELASREMFEILVAPELVEIGAALLGTQEVSAHGIFNARPKLPDQRWTDTPWHQDAQYFRDAEHIHVPTLWYPLQDVTTRNSCLQVQPDFHRGKLHDNYQDETGFVGLAPEDRQKLTGIPIEMQRGDLLCFTQLTPHGALANQSDRVRWSMDLRFEDTEHPTKDGREFGAIARSVKHPATVTTCAEWLRKWDNRPANSY